MKDQALQEKRRKIIIIVAALAVLIVIVILVNLYQNRNEEHEDHGSGLIYVKDEGRLSDRLFEMQYYAVQNALSDYINLAYDTTDLTSAKLASDPTVPKDGVIRIEVEVSRPSERFIAEIDRTQEFGKIVLRVPANNYTKDVEVYQPDTTRETEEHSPQE